MNDTVFPDPGHDHGACVERMVARAERLCARNGGRLTPLRREVFKIVASSHEAMGAYDIIQNMDRNGSRPAPITVYRILDFLREVGLVHKIESRNAFVACTCDHENYERAALLICEQCDTVAEIDATALTSTIKEITEREAFAVRRPVIELSGICTHCSKTA